MKRPLAVHLGAGGGVAPCPQSLSELGVVFKKKKKKEKRDAID